MYLEWLSIYGKFFDYEYNEIKINGIMFFNFLILDKNLIR